MRTPGARVLAHLGRSATEAQLGFDCEHEFEFSLEFEFEVGFGLECEFEFPLELEFELQLVLKIEFEPVRPE